MKYKRYIIWTSNMLDGIELFQKIIEQYKSNNIEPLKLVVHSNQAFGVFQNSDTQDVWKVLRGAESSRGHRGDIAFVDNRITLEVFNEIIRPQTYSTYYPNNIRYWNPAWVKEDKLFEMVFI